MTLTEDRAAWLERLTLDRGSHAEPNGEACVMEAVAYVAGEPFSDHPVCASPIITSFLIDWNDAMDDDDRQMLKPYVPRLVGTRTTEADEQTRAWLLTDWLARECTPAWLRLAGLTSLATQLEALSPLVDGDTAQAAQSTLDIAKKDASAARAAARDAARAAARDAAWAAARDAAGAAAGDAAGAAARAAARDAARDAARAAAWDAAWAAAWAAAGAAARAAAGAAAGDAARAAARDALEPTVKIVQASALVLLDRLIAVR